jgi:hypothetical protein
MTATKSWAVVTLPLAIRVDSEADAELLAKYDVRAGKIFVLVEGS